MYTHQIFRSRVVARSYKSYKMKLNILNIKKCVKNNEKHFYKKTYLRRNFYSECV